MDMALLRALLLLTLLCAAACAEDHGGADSAPAAPSDLEITEVSGGAHLVWSDNSDNEEHFMVMRKVAVDPEYDLVASPTFDAEQYHDADVTPGTTYTYKVVAMNAVGEAESETVDFTAP